MGVTWVFEAEQTAKSVERLLESIGGDLHGTFIVDVTPFNPPTPSSDYPSNVVMHHSKCPQSTFSICPKDTFKKSPKAVCDRGFDLILSKLSSGLIADNAGKIEIIGNEYSLYKDWMIRVGTATQGTTVKGVVVEIEYDPSIIVIQCKDMMIEFVKSVFNKYVTVAPIHRIVRQNAEESYFSAISRQIRCLHTIEATHETLPEIFKITEKPESYTALDTMWQYLGIATKLRKKT